jgi:Trk K+ transport system NAD-binding subunit
MKFIRNIRYKLDKSLIRGFLMISYLLLLALILIVFFISFVDIFLIKDDSKGFLATFIEYFFLAIKGNSISNSSMTHVIINIILMLTGLFISAIVIGFVTNNIRERIDSIRRGSSKIIETNHQIILGWSSGVSLLIRELLLANENNKNSNIVVMDQKDSIKMTGDLMRMFPKRKDYEKVIAREGSTFDRYYLDFINIDDAKSIIINHSDDMQTIKSLAAIVNNPNRRNKKYNVVTKINTRKNYNLARIIGGEESQVLFFGDMLARIDAQTCLQSGLANVYLELVNFDGDEIYFHHEPSLEGKTYRDAVLAYDTSSIIGIVREGDIIINPNFTDKIMPKDLLIAISQDDDTVVMNDVIFNKVHNKDKILKGIAKKSRVEKIYIVGKSEGELQRALVICDQLVQYLDDGSEIVFVNDEDDTNKLIQDISGTKDIKISSIYGDIRSRDFLDSQDFKDEDIILILSPFNGMNNVDECDATTLYTLINLRDIQAKSRKNFKLVTEIIDSKNSEIFQSERNDDYLLSEVIVQSMLVQIAENPFLGKFFEQLTSVDGAEIYFRPIKDYIDISEPIDFYSLCESAGFKGETAIGYQISKKKELSSLNAGVNINPNKSEARLYGKKDKIIVFSQS